MSIIQGIKLIDPISTIERKILSACVKEMNIAFPKAIQSIEDDIKNRIKTIFVNSPEFSALTDNNGLLRYAFGLPQSEAISACDNIINELAESLHVEFRKFTVTGGKSVKGGIRVYAFLADFSDILGLSTSSTTTLKGEQLDWLEWLLIEGDKVIIKDYDMILGNFATSRSGGAIMTLNNKSAWRVPPQYSGTKNDNWITRALDDAAIFVESLITGAIEFNVKKVL